MPAGGALFGSSATRSQNKNLIEFKAGKMTMKGKMVHPDKRKGLVYVYQSEDSLMHFCWKDRTTGTIEDDLIIFPDDCEFKKVTQCTTGRVYVLKFKSSNRKFFFWLQEPKTDKDEENARKIIELLNNPPTPGSQRSGGATPDENLQNLLQNMSQQQLMQLFGGVGQMGGLSSLLGTISRPSTSRPSPTSGGSSSSATTTTTATPKPAPAPSPPRAKPPSASASNPADATAPNTIQLSDLQNFLSGLGVAGAPGSSAPQNVDLSSAINTETLSAVVNNPAVVEELQQHLPSTGGDTSQQEHLRSTLASPQFQQAVSLFSTALQSGQLGPIVSQFEVAPAGFIKSSAKNPESPREVDLSDVVERKPGYCNLIRKDIDVGPEAVSAANQGNMEDFVKALQNTSINTSGSEPSQPEKRKKTEDKKKDDDDEDMALD